MGPERTGVARASFLRVGNQTGYSGVFRVANGKYEASARVDGKRIYLGKFDDVHDAGIAASDFRLQHAVEIEAAYEVARLKRGRSAKRVADQRTPEERRAIVMKGVNARTTEERQLQSRKVRAKQTMAEKQEQGKRGQMKRPLEDRRASNIRGWETKRRMAREAA